MAFLRTLVIGIFLLSATPARSNVSEPTPSLAHNNTIAIAVPLTDIQIDGDLADWPSDLQIYKLRERDNVLSSIDENVPYWTPAPIAVHSVASAITCKNNQSM